MQQLPDFPDRRAFERVGIRLGARLTAGHQSIAHRAMVDAQEVVVKAELAVDASFARRVEMLALLADDNRQVVGPVRLKDRLIHELGGWTYVVYPFIAGQEPDTDRPEQVVAMARTLAALHASMRTIHDSELPHVSPIQACSDAGDPNPIGQKQVIHGDYASSNLIILGGEVRVLDFGEMGLGTCEFEVSNTLFMALFDATMKRDRQRFESFAAEFVPAYANAAGRAIDDVTLEHGLRLRRAALGRWLDDLSQAPVGIRTASVEWRQTLRQFADTDHHDWVKLSLPR